MEVSACPAARVCGMCLRMLSVSLVGKSGRNGEWRSKQEDQETILQCSPCASQRTPVYACAAASSLLWCERAMLLTPTVGLLDDPSVLSWKGDGWIRNGWMRNN